MFLFVIYLLKILSLFLTVWIAFLASRFVLRVGANDSNSRETENVAALELESSVRKFGYNTNSVIHLYGKLDYFRSPDSSLIGYKSLSTQNIMITEPLCPQEKSAEVIL